jgi:hypothetical protein
MTVLVIKEPKRIYQSLGGLTSTAQDRNKADRLDRLLEKGIKRLTTDLKKNRLMPRKAGQGRTRTYWEVGRALRDVADDSNLLERAELPLFWRNAKLYLPEVLLYRDRGPYREHLWYCYRLASYPSELASKMSWGEWVTIFDSTGINQEPRFDTWFKTKLSQWQESLGRSWIRIFAPCVNAMLGNIYTYDLTDVELFSCYEAAWQVVRELHLQRQKEGSILMDRKEIQESIKSRFGLLDAVMEGTLSAYEYAQRIMTNANA